MEQFDPNDAQNPKIPMEFKKYPVNVDELSDIHTKYIDEYYDRFIIEAEKIFDKYNEHKECNPDNNLLYYETDDCNSKLSEHGHGGYICNKSGKWDTNNCILKYCDIGYILDIKNKKCIKDPCENIEIIQETLTCDSNFTVFNIPPNKGYIFTINDTNNLSCSLYFYSELDNFFYEYKDTELKPVKNGTLFLNGLKIYTNMYLNNTENVYVTISNTIIEEKEEEKEEEYNKEYNNTNNYFRGRKKRKSSLAGILLISILVPVVVIGILLAIIFMNRKTIPITKTVEYQNSQDSLQKL
jgi:hypothetical protein